MAAVQRAPVKIDWSRISSSLGLRGTTANSLTAFKKRNDDARRRVQMLQEHPTSVDFGHYRSVLKNTAVVDEVEGKMKAYQVKKYDVSRQIKAIESFEVQAVKSAEETAKMNETELQELDKTIKNIEAARPFEECTVYDIGYAEPVIEKKVEHMLKNGRFMPKGYQEKFGNLSVL